MADPNKWSLNRFLFIKEVLWTQALMPAPHHFSEGSQLLIQELEASVVCSFLLFGSVLLSWRERFNNMRVSSVSGRRFFWKLICLLLVSEPLIRNWTVWSAAIFQWLFLMTIPICLWSELSGYELPCKSFFFFSLGASSIVGDLKLFITPWHSSWWRHGKFQFFEMSTI